MNGTSEAPPTPSSSTPNSILIIGAGVFGLSTLYSLLSDPTYNHTHFTIVDAYAPSPESEDLSTLLPNSSAPLPASHDSSRIIRPDYASPFYAHLASLASAQWRAGWPTIPSGPKPTQVARLTEFYHEAGLLLTCDSRPSRVSNTEGKKYLDESLKNVKQLQGSKGGLSKIEILDSAPKISKVLGTDGSHGEEGYVNWSSGWADASAAMEALRLRTVKLAYKREEENGSKVVWLAERVEKLSFEEVAGPSKEHCVVGAILNSRRELRADLMIVAAGAWSAALLPRSLGPRVKATGQVLAYVRVDRDEVERLRNIPVALNMSTGMFLIPPVPSNDTGEGVLKVARHGWGYTYPVSVQSNEPGEGSEDQFDVYVPAPRAENIPSEGSVALREYMKEAVPWLADRPWAYTRTCWYTDMPTGDWLIDFVPGYGKSLFVATGGSGHAFKVLPVIGDWIKRALEGWVELGNKRVVMESTETLVRGLKNCWRWRDIETVRQEWEGGGDGSRGGKKGMLWTEEMER